MTASAMCALAVAFLAITISAVCQGSPNGKLCVSGMQGAGGNLSPSVSRDALIKFLEKQKNLKGTTQPLNASTPGGDGLVKWKQMGCGYILLHHSC